MTIRPSSHHHQAGFSIIEVMIAIGVLVGALLLTVGQYANVTSLQRQSEATNNINRVVQSLVDRVNSVTWSHLGTERAPWTLPRYEDGRGQPALRETDLADIGLAPRDLGAPDLRVFLEYWRAIDFTDPVTGTIQPGLLRDDQVISSQAFRNAAYINPGLPHLGFRTQYFLDGWDPGDPSEDNSPTQRASVIDPTHPVLVRIVAAWDYVDGVARQRREVITARAP